MFVRKFTAIGLSALFAAAALSPASQAQGLVRFAANTAAKASEVNANFDRIKADADAAQATANSAQSAAGQAQSAANDAQSTADSANSKVQPLSDAIDVSTSGFVGIGESNPEQRLHVAGNGLFEVGGNGLLDCVFSAQGGTAQLTAISNGDATLRLLADRNNNSGGESDNATVFFSQDGGFEEWRIGTSISNNFEIVKTKAAGARSIVLQSDSTEVVGSLSKGGGSFKIDHPLDPTNKYLYHSFVESPDMMNVYNGNVTTDSEGFAAVDLPEWFDTLNRDFRYQLTPIGQFAQAIILDEVQGNRFTILTDKPQVKVSWQVTGIRQDPYAEAHRIPVEVDKSDDERGAYLYPEAYGLPQERSIYSQMEERAKNAR